MTTVHVMKTSMSETIHPWCTADVFASDELTITSVDDGVVRRVYQSGTWLYANVYRDGDGYPCFSFSSRLRDDMNREKEMS